MANQDISIIIKGNSADAVKSLEAVTASLKNVETATGGAKTASDKMAAGFRQTQTATEAAYASFTKLAAAVTAGGVAYMVFSRLTTELNRLFSEGWQAVEDYNTSIASLAAMVLTFTKAHNGMNLEERWKEALKYSTEMIPVLEKLAARTLLSGQETTALANAFARSGVFLDATNAKQIESFTRLSNALPLMTQGQDIMMQINQEIRGLMGGGNEATSMLLKTLKSINPEIENQLQTWREEGTVLEHLGDLLIGFGPATSILENQWQAVKSTIDTTVTQTLRAGMEPVYKDIISLIGGMESGLQGNQGTISAGIVVAWESVKNIVKIVWNLIAGLQPILSPLVQLTGAIAYGWGGILAILEPVSKTIGNILAMGIEVVKVFGNAVLALGALINLQPEVAKVAANEAVKSAKQVGSLAKESASLLTSGIADSVTKYDAEVKRALESGGKVAQVNKYHFESLNNETEKAAAAAKKLREEWEKLEGDLQFKIDTAGMNDFDREMAEIARKYDELRKKFGDKPLLDSAQRADEAQATEKEFSRVAAENAAMYEKMRAAGVEYQNIMQDIQAGITANYGDTTAKIMIEEQRKHENITKMMDQGLISFEQAEAAWLVIEQETTLRIMEEDAKKLEAKATYYSAIKGMEAEAQKAALGAIEIRKQMEIKATGDKITAENKAARLIKQISSDLLVKKNMDLQESFRYVASTLSATADLYEEDSREHKALSEASKAATIAEMALQVQKNLLIAVGAVVQQGTGDPYTAFARIAAMIGVVAGVLSIAGIAFSPGGGGSSSASSTPSAYSFSDTVLGAEAGTGSESIANSWELLQETYDMEDTKLTKIYEEMKSLNSNITGLVSNIIRTGSVGGVGGIDLSEKKGWAQSTRDVADTAIGGIFTGHLVTDAIFGKDSMVTSVLTKLSDIFTGLFSSTLGAIFGGSIESSISGTGIRVNSSSIGNLMSGGGVNPQAWTSVHYKKDGGWFGSDEEWTDDYYGALNGNVTSVLNKVFQNMGQTIVSLTEALGGDVTEALNYTFSAGNINLYGMGADQINETLSTYFSNMADNAVEAVVGGIIAQYQEVGEGLMETASRLVIDKAVVLETLEMTGNAYTGTAAQAIELSEALIELAGDLETLREAAETYYDKFYSDAEKQTRLQGQLADVFSYLNLALPSARDGYRAVVEGLDLTTESGRSAYVTLLQLAESADAYYSYMEELASQRASLEIELMELQGNAAGALAAQRERELAAMDESLRPLQELIWLTQDWADTLSDATSAATSAIEEQISAARSAASTARSAAAEYENISTSLQDAMDQIRGVTTARAAGKFASTYATAMTGDQDALAALPGLADSLQAASLASSRTAVEYAREQGKTLIALDRAKTVSTAMVNWEEYHATLLSSQVSVLEEMRDELAQPDPNTVLLTQQAALLEDIGSLLAHQTTQIVSGNNVHALLMHDQTGKIILANQLTTDQTGKIALGNTWLTDLTHLTGFGISVAAQQANMGIEATESGTATTTAKLEDTKAASLWMMAQQYFLVKDGQAAAATDAGKAFAATEKVSSTIAAGVDIDSAVSIGNYLNEVKTALAANNSAEAQAARSAIATLRQVTADGLIETAEAEKTTAALADLKTATAWLMIYSILTNEKTAATATADAAKALSGLLGVTGAVSSQTSQVIAGNDLTDDQTAQIITGNATSDVIKNLQKLNTNYSAEMLTALISRETEQTSSLDGILQANQTTVSLIRQLVDLTNQSRQDKLLAEINAAKAGLAPLIETAKSTYATANEAQAAIATAREQESAAVKDAAITESDTARSKYQSLLATYQKAAGYYTVAENLATGTPYSAHGYYTYGSQTAENNAAYAAYIKEFKEAYALRNYIAPDSTASVAAAITTAQAAAEQAAKSVAAFTEAKTAYDTLLKKYEAEYGDIPGFASGGSFAGGLRIVGEEGPELEFTGPSYIANASRTEALLNNNAALVDEIRALRQEVRELKAAANATAKYTQKTAKVLDNATSGALDANGYPAIRTAA